MSDPVLYDYWRSSASYRLRIALNLKNVAYKAVSVDLLGGAHREVEHLARNPQGLVPALEIDGLMLTQSLAILDYLEDTRPTPPLLPSAAAQRARVRALAHVLAVDVHPICNLSVTRHAATLSGEEGAMAAWMRHFIPKGLEAFEALLAHPGTGRFCHGDAPGLADICLIPQLYNARRWGADYSGHSRICAIEAACAELAAFKAAEPDAVRPA